MSGSPTEAFTLRLDVAGRTVEGRVAVPSAPVPAETLLPVFHQIADTVVRLTGDLLAGRGTPITCGEGCAACCRKLVPISAAEARFLTALVSRLPRERREAVAERFRAARERLRSAGLLEALDRPDLDGDEVIRLAGPYFDLWLDCPFLEGERCSIYADRPAACREYLVVSPPPACFPDSEETAVDRVRLPLSVSNRLAALEPCGWVPLALAPDLTARLPAEPPQRSGAAWLGAVLEGPE